MEGATRLQQDAILVCMFDKRYMDIALKTKYSMSVPLLHHGDSATSWATSASTRDINSSSLAPTRTIE
jgi:hypothetical protein